MGAHWRKPMPPEAKAVFKGKIFEVWQWEQKLYDGTTATFERLKRPDTVDIITAVGDKIVIQYQEQPDTGEFISLPSGRCEEGEEPKLSAERELLEETGLSSNDWELINEDAPSSKIEWTIYTFVARNCVKTQEPNLDAGEKIRLDYVSFDELLLLPENPQFRSIGPNALFWRARLDSAKKEELRALIFGKN